MSVLALLERPSELETASGSEAGASPAAVTRFGLPLLVGSDENKVDEAFDVELGPLLVVTVLPLPSRTMSRFSVQQAGSSSKQRCSTRGRKSRLLVELVSKLNIQEARVRKRKKHRS